MKIYISMNRTLQSQDHRQLLQFSFTMEQAPELDPIRPVHAKTFQAKTTITPTQGETFELNAVVDATRDAENGDDHKWNPFADPPKPPTRPYIQLFTLSLSLLLAFCPVALYQSTLCIPVL
jgi:hypothetical protein